MTRRQIANSVAALLGATGAAVVLASLSTMASSPYQQSAHWLGIGELVAAAIIWAALWFLPDNQAKPSPQIAYDNTSHGSPAKPPIMSTIVATAEDRKDTASSGTDDDGNVTGEVIFDHSGSDRRIVVPSPRGEFHFYFSRCAESCVYFYPKGNIRAFRSFRGVSPHEEIKFENFSPRLHTYQLFKDEALGVINYKGEVLIGRIVDISDASRGAAKDEVRMLYRIFERGIAMTVP